MANGRDRNNQGGLIADILNGGGRGLLGQGRLQDSGSGGGFVGDFFQDTAQDVRDFVDDPFGTEAMEEQFRRAEERIREEELERERQREIELRREMFEDIQRSRAAAGRTFRQGGQGAPAGSSFDVGPGNQLGTDEDVLGV